MPSAYHWVIEPGSGQTGLSGGGRSAGSTITLWPLNLVVSVLSGVLGGRPVYLWESQLPLVRRAGWWTP